VEFNAGIRPRNKLEYLGFRQVFTTLGFALRKLESPSPALESAAPDRERAETARPRWRRSVVVGFSGGLGALTARFRMKAAVDRGFRRAARTGFRGAWKAGLSAREAGPGRASETGGIRGFGARPPAGSLRGSPRTAAYRGAWLGTVRGPSSAANATRSTARL
jgi:hypothetical protein